MPVTVKLITEQTTNLLESSVNKAQANGWYPVCGVVWFNARYTQLMAHDSNGTEVPKCNYFLVDSEDGIDFANRVNKLVALNTGASCLSSVQYVNARYIQAWGDDTLHHGGGSGDLPKWYTEDAGKTYPIIDVDPNLSQIGLGNEWAGYVQLLFRTGGNNAGYILADDGTLTLHKSSGSEITLQDDYFSVEVDDTYPFEAYADNVRVRGAGSELSLSNMGFQAVTPGGYDFIMNTAGYKLRHNDVERITVSDNVTTVASSGSVIGLSGPTITMNTTGDAVNRASFNISTLTDSTFKAGGAYSAKVVAGNSEIAVSPTGFAMNTPGEYHYLIDSNYVFFSSGDITKIVAQGMYLQLDDGDQTILVPATYSPTVSNSVATKGYVDNQRPVNAVFRASFTTTSAEATQYVTANNTPQVVTFNAQAIPNATLGTLDNATGIFTAAREIIGTLAITCQVRRTTGGSAAVTWGFQVETSPDGIVWTPTPGSARYINLRGAGDNNVLQTVNLTAAVDIPAGTRVRITQMTDTSSANVGLVALPAMLGGATAAGLVFSLSTTI